MTIVYCTNDYLKVLTVETVLPHNFPFGAILDLSFFHKGAMCLRGAFLSVSPTKKAFCENIVEGLNCFFLRCIV